jgi:hypothetical protein
MPAKAAARKTKPKVTPAAKQGRSKSSRGKVSAYRARMRAKGYRLVQMWLPDTRTPEFAAEARRQSRLANASPLAASDQAWVESLADWNGG